MNKNLPVWTIFVLVILCWWPWWFGGGWHWKGWWWRDNRCSRDSWCWRGRSRTFWFMFLCFIQLCLCNMATLLLPTLFPIPWGSNVTTGRSWGWGFRFRTCFNQTQLFFMKLFDWKLAIAWHKVTCLLSLMYTSCQKSTSLKSNCTYDLNILYIYYNILYHKSNITCWSQPPKVLNQLGPLSCQPRGQLPAASLEVG